MSEPLPLSVLVITKNEAHNIADCLASVSFAAEVLVVDSGSTDATRELAEHLGARVMVHPFESAGRQRNWALPLLSHDWCLVVDADERVTPELAAEISEKVRAGGPTNGYSLPRQSYFLGTPIQHAGWGRDRVLRLFRKARGRYDDALVHESLKLTGMRGELAAPLLHYTYRTLDDYLAKTQDYTARGAADLRTRGQRTTLLTLLVRPPARFARMYILQRGYRDGVAGLVLCLLTAYSVWLKYAQRWEADG